MRETALWQGTKRQWPAVSFIIHTTGHSDEVNSRRSQEPAGPSWKPLLKNYPK